MRCPNGCEEPLERSVHMLFMHDATCLRCRRCRIYQVEGDDEWIEKEFVDSVAANMGRDPGEVLFGMLAARAKALKDSTAGS